MVIAPTIEGNYGRRANKVDNSILSAETSEENIQSTTIETQEPSEEQKSRHKKN